MSESGVPGYEVTAWLGILVPRGVPREVIAKLNAHLVREAHAPDIKKLLSRVGAEPAAGSPAAYAAFIQAEKTKWAQVITKAGITAN